MNPFKPSQGVVLWIDLIDVVNGCIVVLLQVDYIAEMVAKKWK